MLKIIDQLLEQLNKNKIAYCQWKSSEHLQKSLEGLTDLDLLVSKKDKFIFKSILDKFNIVRMKSSLDPGEEYIEHYLGMDFETGKLIHIHTYYRIVVGFNRKKTHILPVEEIIIENSKKHEDFDIFIPLPELEIILLFIRIMLKFNYSYKELTKDIIGRKNFINANLIKEFRFLQNRIRLNTSTNFDVNTIPFEVDKYLKEFTKMVNEHTIKGYKVRRLQKSVIQKLLPHLVEIPSNNSNGSVNNFFNKKKIITGGKSFAFIGIDGAGKSTIVKELKTWLSWKIYVDLVYMGKQRNTLINLVAKLNVFGRLSKKFSSSFLSYIFSYLNDLFYSLQMLIISKRKLNLYKKSKNINEMGHIVIFDRYPLKFFYDMADPMDGPKINNNIRNKSSLVQFLSNSENFHFNQIGNPDYTFILKVNLKNSLLRKKDHYLKLEQLRKKLNAVHNILSDDSHVIVDSNQDLETTLLDVKRKVWARISKRSSKTST